MLKSPLVIGALAGFGSALLFASSTSGTVLAAFLFYATPLPLFLAGLGFGTVAQLSALLVATLATGLFYNMLTALGFAAAIAGPAMLLSRLPQLGRPLDPANPGAGVRWYPTGRIVLWAAGLATLVVGAAMLVVGFDGDEFQTELRQLLTGMLQSGRTSGLVPDGSDLERVAALLALAIPPGAAAIWTGAMVLNLWLGARVVSASGGLVRPWPRLSDMDFPPVTAAVFGLALGASFLDGEAGLIASVLAAALFVAYMLLGLATVHRLTERSSARGLILTAVYLALLLLPWMAVFVSALGVADNLAALRHRRIPGAPPPSANPGP